MTPMERARGVMARYRAGKPDETPPLARLIAEAIEQAEKDAVRAERARMRRETIADEEPVTC